MSSCLRSLLNMFFLPVSVPPAWIVPSGPSCRSVPVSTDTQQRLPHSNHRNCEQWLPHQCLPPRMSTSSTWTPRNHPRGQSTLRPPVHPCLLYTSDAADDLLCVDLGGRRIIKKKKRKK